MKIQIARDDSIPAFGAFHCPPPGQQVEPGLILLNVEACLGGCVDEGGAEEPMDSADKKRLLIETLMHEFGHALEHHFGLGDDETAIEAAIASWTPSQPRSVGGIPTAESATGAAPAGNDGGGEAGKPQTEEWFFRRAEGFYIIDVSIGSMPETHAKLNPGTLEIRRIATRELLWPTGPCPKCGAQVADPFFGAKIIHDIAGCSG